MSQQLTLDQLNNNCHAAWETYKATPLGAPGSTEALHAWVMARRAIVNAQGVAG